MSDAYLVVTEFGNVMLTVNPDAANGLDDDLLQFRWASAQDSDSAPFHTPLRAFAVKMVDIILETGFEGVTVPASMRDMLVREKATEELSKIERWARQNA